jgi:hypothetical protein
MEVAGSLLPRALDLVAGGGERKRTRRKGGKMEVAGSRSLLPAAALIKTWRAAWQPNQSRMDVRTLVASILSMGSAGFT